MRWMAGRVVGCTSASARKGSRPSLRKDSRKELGEPSRKESLPVSVKESRSLPPQGYEGRSVGAGLVSSSAMYPSHPKSMLASVGRPDDEPEEEEEDLPTEEPAVIPKPLSPVRENAVKAPPRKRTRSAKVLNHLYSSVETLWMDAPDRHKIP